MCSVNGFVSFAEAQMRVSLGEFLKLATNRGRDSYGIYVYGPDCQEHILKNINKIDQRSFDQFDDNFVVKPKTVFMNNMRAEPTSKSEWIRDKTPNDTQPFSDRSSTIIHNGTVSNDMVFNKRFVSLVVGQNGEWADRYQDEEIKIDSAVFLNYRTSGALIRGLILGQVVGSFACVQFFKESGDVVFYKNYMPLYLMVDYTNKFIWWASERETFAAIHQTDPGLEYTIIDMPAYSYLVLNIYRSWEEIKQAVRNNIQSFLNTNKSKSLVVCSGGLDSTTVAALAKQKGEDITLLHFLYGCRAEERESEAIPKIAEYLQCMYRLIPITIFQSLLTSPLTEQTGDISTGDTGIEYAHEWVPARNLILMSLAIGYAERYGYSRIYLGANLDEASAFPDNSKDFLDKLAALVPYSVQNGVKIEIAQPVGNLMKHEIVQLAIDIKAPLHLMWSCYHGGQFHCGECGPCNLRRIAFRKNGLEDTYVQYQR